MAAAVLEADDMRLRVVAYGEQAEALAAETKGSELEIDGDLVVHTWKTEEGREHERWEILTRTLTKRSTDRSKT